MEAIDVNEVSDDELEAEYQEAAGLDDFLKTAQSRETSALWRPQGQARQVRAETRMHTRSHFGSSCQRLEMVACPPVVNGVELVLSQLS